MSDLTIDILKGARARLELDGWVQGAEAMNADGVAVEDTDESAAGFCLLGAIGRAGYDIAAAGEADVDSVLDGVMRAQEIAGDVAGDLLHAWNDHPDRTLEETLALVDEAIARGGGEPVARSAGEAIAA